MERANDAVFHLHPEEPRCSLKRTRTMSIPEQRWISGILALCNLNRSFCV